MSGSRPTKASGRLGDALDRLRAQCEGVLPSPPHPGGFGTTGSAVAPPEDERDAPAVASRVAPARRRRAVSAAPRETRLRRTAKVGHERGRQETAALGADELAEEPTVGTEPQGTLYDRQGKPRRGIYALLEHATPAQRRDILLAMLEERPGGRLELPTLDDGTSANLAGVDLSREAMLAEFGERISEGAPWWDSRARRVLLQAADLRGADLRQANLGEADLHLADLRGANLEEAELQGAELSGAQLQEACLNSASLRRARLLRASLQRASAWEADLQRAHLGMADLQGADLRSAEMQLADMHEACMQGAVLSGADLQGARLSGADLRGADLREADLQAADLTYARLHQADLSFADLNDAALLGASLDHTRLYRSQLGEQLGDQNLAAGGPPSSVRPSDNLAAAADVYTLLRANFESLGDYDGSRWAYLRSRRLDKLASWNRFRESLTGPHADVRSLLRCAYDELAELVCDYGESIWRILATMAVVVLVFAYIYWAFWGLIRVPEGTYTSRLADDLRFSIAAMATAHPTGLQASRESIELLATIQGLLGIGLTGLLGFVAGRRIHRS